MQSGNAPPMTGEMESEASKPDWRRRVFLTLRIGLALALLIWVWTRLDAHQLQALSWSAMNLRWLLLAFALGGISVLGWAGRWWWFLRVYEVRARYPELLRLTLFADFFNLYFLGPIGADGIRLLLLSRRFPERRGAILGSLLLDHVGGFFGGMLLYLFFAKHSGLSEGVLKTADLSLWFFGLATFLGLGVIMEPPIQRLFQHIPGLRWISQRAASIYAGTFRHPWLFSGFAISTLGTACAYAAYWAAAHALGAHVSLPQMLGLMPVVDLIASLPVTISGIGVREGLLVEWLGHQPHWDAAHALAVSLLGFAALGLWGLIGGVWLAFWKKKDAMPSKSFS